MKKLLCHILFFLIFPELRAENLINPDGKIYVNLTQEPIPNHSELYGKIHLVNKSLQFNLNTKDIRFIIFQVHSQIYPLTLSQSAISSKNNVTGINIGIHSETNSSMIFIISNINKRVVNAYVSIHGYSDFAPIPGGCNMEFPLAISPFLRVTNTIASIIVEASPANDLFFLNCQHEISNMSYSLYRVYLMEKDLSEDSYFSNIANMVNIDTIEKFGKQIPLHAGYAPLRRTFSAYPGTGSIYVFVVRTAFGQAAYVPASSYACDLTNPLGSCEYNRNSGELFLMLLLGTIGLFLAYFGHTYFKTEMFILGFAFGALLSYMLGLSIGYTGLAGLDWSSFMIGAFMGFLWLLFWCYFGIPVYSVQVATFLLGCFIAAFIFYVVPPGIEMFETPTSFWLMFASIVMFVQTAAAFYLTHANVLACAVIGSFVAICCFDTLLGSCLKYIVVDILRRATVEGFTYAVATPPFQHWDLYLMILWTSMFLTATLFQLLSQRAQPPFPPPPRTFRFQTGERTPLLSNATTGRGNTFTRFYARIYPRNRNNTSFDI